MFRLAFGVVICLLLWLQSLFTQTAHVVSGETHIFKYNWVPWFFLGLISFALVGFAEIARRLLKDRVLAVICLLGIPLFGLVSLQFLYERVEVSRDLLVHRREPPHTRFNADIPWDSIEAATKIEREQAGFFGPDGYTVGYQFTLRTGGVRELPSNTVLTHAHDEIDRMLAARQIPVATQRIPIPQ